MLPLFAVGGVLVHAGSGDPGSIFVGLGSASLLGMAAAALSDMQGTGGGANIIGELGVKAAFGKIEAPVLLHLYIRHSEAAAVLP